MNAEIAIPYISVHSYHIQIFQPVLFLHTKNGDIWGRIQIRFAGSFPKIRQKFSKIPNPPKVFR